MLKLLKRSLSIALAALMLMSVFPVCAEGFGANSKVYIIKNTLNAYKSKSTSSKVLGVMTYGENMTMVSFSGDWVKIKNAKGQIGYCKLTGLSSQNPNTLDETVYAKNSKTVVYHKASTSYKKLKTVKQNTKLNVVAATPDGKWFRVKNGKNYGYVRVEDVNKNPVSTHGAITSKKVWVVSDGAVEVTSKKGGGKDMGLISHGQSYTLLSVSGNYSKIKNAKGQVGWCRSDILSTDNPNKENATMYTQVGGNILYTNSIIKGSGKYIKKGAKVTMVAETPEGGWYRVKYNGKYYYIDSIFLDDEKAPEGGRTVYCRDDEYIYAKPSFSAKKVTKVEAYEELYLVGSSKGAAKVKTASGKTGYIPTGMLEPSVWTFAVPKK